MSIQPLLPDVIAQIKSSTTITSLNGVIFELLKNSLDAKSTKVDISVDYSRGGCVVEDDGLGIPPSEFGEKGGLGKLYHSSKLHSETPVHGRRGTFLASLSALSLLSITSHHHLHRSHNTLSMHKSEVVSRHMPATAVQCLPYFDHGTRVTVRNLFGNLPVRVKQRAIIAEKQKGASKEWEALKNDVVILLLAWPQNVAVKFRELGGNQQMSIRTPSNAQAASEKLETLKICMILSQASLISFEQRASWVSVGASTPKIRISGAIALDPCAIKNVQFLSFGIQPLKALEGQSIFHDEINRLFANSTFGNDDAQEQLDDVDRNRNVRDAIFNRDRYTSKELKRGKKGVERWPMFYINLDQTSSSTILKTINVDDILDDRGSILNEIIELLQSMILEFLTKHHFSPKSAYGQRSRKYHHELHKSSQITIDKCFQKANRRTYNSAELKSPVTVVPSSSQSTGEKDNLGRILSTNSDLLGANVKLPSFHHLSTTPGSPFNTWSRIKSGVKKPHMDKIHHCSPAQPLPRSASAPPPSSCSIAHHIPEKNPVRSTKPLLSVTGKITRYPFEDIPTDPYPSKPTPPVIPTESAEDKLEDDIMTWTNPITKVRSLVDKRTGLTISLTTSNTGFSPRTKGSNAHSRLSSRPNLKATISGKTSESTPWISNILKTWDNPIFLPTEATMRQISFNGPGSEAQNILTARQYNYKRLDMDTTISDSSTGISRQISRDALRQAEIIAQVDKKFVLLKIRSNITEEGLRSMLVIVDQHAADERIRIENLMEELCTPPPSVTNFSSSVGFDSTILTTPLERGVSFDVLEKEIQLLRTHQRHFADWGICFDLPANTIVTNAEEKSKKMQRLTVRSLPAGIVERCKKDPRLLIDLIRSEVWAAHLNTTSSSSVHSLPSNAVKHSWLKKIHTCPQGILAMLNSRACRSAIMFNDELSREQCETLVQRLAECAFPFQCAHGRPSLVPLVDLGRIREGEEVIWNEYPDVGPSFGMQFGKWKRLLQRDGG